MSLPTMTGGGALVPQATATTRSPTSAGPHLPALSDALPSTPNLRLRGTIAGLGEVVMNASYGTRLRDLFELLQEPRDLQGVGRPVVAEAVVHQHVRLGRLPRGVADGGDPVAELVLVVQVAEALGGGDVALLPRLRIPAVEPE